MRFLPIITGIDLILWILSISYCCSLRKMFFYFKNNEDQFQFYLPFNWNTFWGSANGWLMSSYRFKLSELFLAFSEILGLIYSERPDKERSTPTSSSSEEELGNSSFLALSIYFLRLSFSLMYSYRILLISCYFSSSLMSMGISSTLFFETYSIFLVF